MELKKKKIYMSRQEAEAATQITLDEDRNVPDQKPDMETIVLEKADVTLSDTRLREERAELSGELCYSLLYQTEDGGMDSLSGTVPFSDMVNIPGAKERDHIQVRWAVEDLHITMIHSRKLNIKAVLSFGITAETLFEEEVAWDAQEETGHFETQKKKLSVTQLSVQKRDTFRVREDVELSGSKPNISRLLFSSLTLGGTDCRAGDMELFIRGECKFLAVYQSEEEHMPVQWVEKAIPFSGTIDLPDCTDDMLPDVQISLLGKEIQVKPDQDGENRIIAVEGVLDLEIKLYEEADITILDDVYAPDRNLVPEYGTAEFESLLGRNISKEKWNGKIALEKDEKLLQICCADGNITLDRIQPGEEGLILNGSIGVTVLYISADDSRPMKSCREIFPYTHMAEIRGLDETARYQVTPALEQLSVQMIGGEEIEIRARLSFDAIAFRKREERVMTQIGEQPFNQKAVDEMPGIIGYIVQPKDSLWNLAKQFHTTMENIKAVNHMQKEELMPGEKLLIVKQTEGL